MNHEEKISTAIHKIFPEAVVNSTLKFSKGLASTVYKVELSNPDQILAVKIFPKKIETRVEKSLKISNYARENGIPTPRSYDIVNEEEVGWVVMDCLPGVVASEAWEVATAEQKKLILDNSGATLKKIHNLKIPTFWIHEKHEITSNKEWILWTKLRIQKYLAAAEQNLDKELFDFLVIKFKRLQELYDTGPEFRIVPLHWDFHLSNINVDENSKISGVFDFDNAMKGHDMADLGQTMYWLVIQQKVSNTEMFDTLFAGYGGVSRIDREFVQLQFLLFLAGVMRSTWSKEHLRWLNDLHVEVLKRCTQREYALGF
jgi:Ser/Thr protein kinase RdoA (MazF antagonist)